MPDQKNTKILTPTEIREGCILLSHGENEGSRLCIINEEFRQAFEFIPRFPKSVSIFGSARFKEGNAYYEAARSLASKIVKETGYAIVTGGGPGIMEAANRGAKEANGTSVGLTIQLPYEQVTNPYLTDELAFYYFFSRKVTLSYAAEAYVFMPGGFGTMDELFEILTLVQTKKIERAPVILYGTEFWKPMMEFIVQKMRDDWETIDPNDLDLMTITDEPEMILDIIKTAPIRKRA